MSISLKRKKIFQKENCHSSVFRKFFQISRKKFSCHIHLKTFLIPTVVIDTINNGNCVIGPSGVQFGL